jgi:TonB family protein
MPAMLKRICGTSKPLIMILLVVGTAAASDARSDLEKTLRNELNGNILVLRHYLRGNLLSFNADGTAVGNAEAGTWIADSAVKLNHVKLSHDRLQMDGDRVISFYNVKGTLQQLVHHRRPLKLEIALGPEGADKANVDRVLHAVFLGRTEIDAVQPPSPASVSELKDFERSEDNLNLYRRKGTLEWKICKEMHEPLAGGRLENGETVYYVCGPVVPPKPIEVPDPDYPAGEKRERREGKAVLSIVVDSQGRVRTIGLKMPNVTGFELQALEAVSRWKFQPATMSGKSVATCINVEVNYRLH